MAITAGKVKITVRGVLWSQQVEIVQWFSATGAAFLTADAVQVGEAFWNDIKTVWRAAQVNYSTQRTTSIVVSEPGSSGAFGEFAVPIAEQQGTRTPPASGSYLPTFCAAAFRETVATRATRPGQKRIWGAFEGDVNDDGTLAAPYKALIDAIALKFTENITLGAPVATGVLVPIVARVDRVTGAVTAQQDITGFITNPSITTQVSRKIGRGI